MALDMLQDCLLICQLFLEILMEDLWSDLWRLVLLQHAIICALQIVGGTSSDSEVLQILVDWGGSGGGGSESGGQDH